MGATGPNRVFLISPASCGGLRARQLFKRVSAAPTVSSDSTAPGAAGPRDLAASLRSPAGAPLAEVFAFLSSLYFTAKLAYANAFANPPAGQAGVHVITACEGLRLPKEPVDIARLRRFGEVPIDARDARYREPLVRDARRIAEALPPAPACEVVLLGSVASGKYVELLADAFGSRLRFPGDFVGRGDMSRGGLMLRCVEDRSELAYVPLDGAKRRGQRPPRLASRPGLLTRLNRSGPDR
jgi:hypothetical protein